MSQLDFRVNADQAATRGHGGEVEMRTRLAGGSIDAAGRIRVGTPYGIFESKQIYNADSNVFYTDTNGTGASSTHLSNEAASSLDVGTASGEYTIRQTTRYYAYVPGKSHLIVLTGVPGAPKANVSRRIGYFDDDNGLYFEIDSIGWNVVRRSSTSGSIVNTSVAQADWNLDTMDGSGDANNPSGIEADPTKIQVMIIDFQWLGADIVRFGFKINGEIIYCHQIYAANALDAVYIATPDLPIRYEIRNTGVAASASSLKQVCSSISSEAGYQLPGFEYSVGTAFPLRTITTTRTPILAIRQLTTFNGKTNRRAARLLNARMIAQTNDIYAELAHLHLPSGITANWNPVHANSSIEYTTDITAITGNPEHVIDSGYVATGVPGQGGSVGSTAVEALSRHTYIHQNYAADNSQVFVIYARSQTGSADVGATMGWVEFD